MKNVFTSIFSRPIFKVISLLGLGLLIGFIYLGFIAPVVPDKGFTLKPAGQLRVKVLPGSNVASTAKQLASQGVQVSNITMQIVARVLFQGKKLKAGVYDFAPKSSLATFLFMRGGGDSIKLGVTLVEGWTFKQFKSSIDVREGVHGRERLATIARTHNKSPPDYPNESIQIPWIISWTPLLP